MRVLKLFIFVNLFILYHTSIAQDSLVGHWNFNNPGNLTEAVIGSELVLFGNHSIVDGPEAEDGAINIPVGSYYIVSHNIAANGGGANVNEFSLVMDVKIPQTGKWYCMYQTDMTNTDDGEWFIRPTGNIGVGSTGYTETQIKPGEWYRLAISVKNGSQYKYYFDGHLLLNGNAGEIDGRFSLGTEFILFGDNNGEDNAIDVADVKLFSRALSDSELAALGGYGHNPYSGGEKEVEILPYLQSPTPSSVFISWHAPAIAGSFVEYGKTESLSQTAKGSYQHIGGDYNWHTVELNELVPETIYYYKAVTDTFESAIYKFKTPPDQGSAIDHVRFSVYGDNCTVPADHLMVINAMKTKMIELYGEDLEENVNLVLNVGDIVTNGLNYREYKNEWFEPVSPLSSVVPFMISIGNHENESDYFYQYMKYEDFGGTEGEKYYSFLYGRVLFIAINSNWQLRNDTQITWLDNLLQEAETDDSIDWVFAFCHHPGRSEVWPDGNTAYVQDRVIPTLSKYSKAEFLMYGHSHNYERGAVDEGNLGLMLNGGGGSALDRWRMYGNQRDYPEIQRSFDHYCYSIFDIDIANRSYICQTFSLGTKDFFYDNIPIDSLYRKQTGTIKPAKPSALTVPDTVDLPYTFQISAYSGGTEPLLSSQFKFTIEEGDYNDPVFESKRDFENIYYDTGPPDYEPIDLNAGIDLSQISVTADEIIEGGNYYWQARYRDKNLQWSEWSDENTVYVRSSYRPPLAYNKALSFDGAETYISITDDLNNAQLPVKNMTVETWVNLKTHHTWGGYIGVVQDNGGYEKGWVLGNYNDKFSFALSSKGTGDSDGLLTYLESSGTFQNNRWYHVAGTYNGNTMKVYANGQLKGSSTAQSGDIFYDISSYFSIGAYHDANEFNVLNGLVDEVRLWDAALTEETIQAWMHQEINESHPQYANLISDWDCNELSGNVLPDYKDNNNGKLQNMKVLNQITSTAPLGLISEFVETQTATQAGAEGTMIKVQITSTPNSSNYLGIYQSGGNDGSSVTYETFPEGIKYRSNIFWGIWEYGNVTSDIALYYEQINGIASPDSLKLLKRNNAQADWDDVTVNFLHDQANRVFSKSAETNFNVEYALGWKTNITAIDNEQDNLKPEEFRLSQNYPNPFNATTTVKYVIKSNGHVVIAVYNIRGQNVATLVEKNQNAGKYTVRWDASGLSSGIYFYQIKTEDFSDVKKMMLMK